MKIIITAAKLIAPIIERDGPAGFDYIIDALRKAGRLHVAAEMEIAKAVAYLKDKRFEEV